MADANVVVAVTKSTLWHDQEEEFDNVYYFDGPPVTGQNPQLWQDLADHIVAAERPIHGINVNFKLARVWSTGGTIVQNITLGLFDKSGTGTDNSSTILFKESAVLVEWECDRANVLGRKVYLRKYLRPCVNVGAMNSNQISGQLPLPTATKDKFKTYADAVQQFTIGGGVDPFKLCSPSGRVPRTGTNGVVNNYLISREFRRN